MRGQDVFDGLARLSHLKYHLGLCLRLASNMRKQTSHCPIWEVHARWEINRSSGPFRTDAFHLPQATTSKPISHKFCSTARSSSYATIQRHRRVFPRPRIYAPERGFRPYTKLLQAGDIFGPDEPSRVLRIASGVYRGIRVQKEQVGPVLVPSR